MKKLILLAAIIGAFALFLFNGGVELLKPDVIVQLLKDYPNQAIAIYFVIYVLVTALSLPGAAIMTVLGGALFGLGKGVIIVSFASSVGATLAFVISRTLLRDWVQNKFGHYLEGINKGLEKDGAFYLLTLRLMPIFPFFVINLVMGLTRLKVFTFYWVSQLGMLAGTAIFVNAGAELAEIDTLTVEGIFSPSLFIGFMLLGIFPLIAKAIVASIQKRRVYKQWQHLKPKQYDANLIVIGAGSAGLVSSLIAAAVKAKVILIEKNKMGGDCLNTGCVPSKAIIRSGKIAHYINHAERYGLDKNEAKLSFETVMARVHNVIKEIEPHDSIERYTGLGVDVVQGEAEIISPWEVVVDGKHYRAKSMIIASGGLPAVPQIEGIETIDVLTSENLWELKQLPEKLLVMGGGPIGCELAQAFQRLGSSVAIVHSPTHLMVREDEDVSEVIRQRFSDEGINVLTGHRVIKFIKGSGSDGNNSTDIAQVTTPNGDIIDIEFTNVICAVGRTANLNIKGLGALELETDNDGTLSLDEKLRTRYPNIYACGDVAGPYQFTHVAAHQAWFASVNALFGKFKTFNADYSVIPWATFTDPEVATVGLNELTAKEKGVAYEVTRYGIDDLDRAIADSENHGFIKVLTVPGKDKILGVTIVGYHASAIIAEYVLAMRHGLGLNKILGTIHIYPTLTESNKYLAGEWKRNHAPEKLLAWVEKYHRWVK